MQSFIESKTLSADNQFHFACPIFGTKEKLTDCLKIEERHKIGKRTEGREGCNACMASSKCPIWHILQGCSLRNEDLYYAKDTEVRRLDSKLMDRIAPIMVQENHINFYAVPADQAKLMNESSGRKGKLFTALGDRVQLAQIEHDEPRRKSAESKTTRGAVSASRDHDKILRAALSGDMSAGLNVAASDLSTPEPAPVAPAPTPAASSETKPLSLLERARMARERNAA